LIKLVLILVVMVGVGLVSSSLPYGTGVSSILQEARNENISPRLAVVFAGWYGYDHRTGECIGGLGSTHWNDGPDTGGIVYQPEIGFYCSGNPEVVAWQLQQIEQAGISVIFYSWWGWGDGNLDGVMEGHPDQYINRSLIEMLDQIQSSGSDLRVALVVEPFMLTQAGLSQMTNVQEKLILDYLWEHYYSLYPEQMFRWQGKPLLLAFDPVQLREDQRYTLRHWTGRARDPQTETEGWDWFFAPPQGVIEGMSDDGAVFVYPRFDEFYIAQGGASYITWKPRRVDPYLKEGVYERQWQQVEENRERIKLIVLYSWNLYGEQAQIEPSKGCCAPVGDEYVRKTKDYYRRFMKSER
jgi:hypothetical protein